MLLYFFDQTQNIHVFRIFVHFVLSTGLNCEARLQDEQYITVCLKRGIYSRLNFSAIPARIHL